MKQIHSISLGTAALLTLFGCADTDSLSPLAPAAPSFTQIADAPVVNSLADPGSGTCDDAECTLREAIAFANPGARITFSVTGTINLSRALTIEGQDLTIAGPTPAGITVAGSDDPDVGGLLDVQDGATATLSHLTLAGAGTEGSAIYVREQGTLTIQHSTISGNNATRGVINNFGSVTLQNTTFSGNDPRFSVTENWGVLIVTHSTIVHNSNVAPVFGNGRVAIANSIVVNGSMSACVNGEAIADNGYNLFSDGSCAANSGTSTPNATSLLGSLQDNGGATLTHALLAGSPAIDAIPVGTNGCGFGTDQRGFTRPKGSGCDIGAFELQPPTEVQPPTFTLTIEANGTLTKKTGAATIHGTLTCSTPVTVMLNAELVQEQTKRKNATGVNGTGSIEVGCNVATPWSLEITSTSGKFVRGAAAATAAVEGTDPLVQAAQTVQLK